MAVKWGSNLRLALCPHRCEQHCLALPSGWGRVCPSWALEHLGAGVLGLSLGVCRAAGPRHRAHRSPHPWGGGRGEGA